MSTTSHLSHWCYLLVYVYLSLVLPSMRTLRLPDSLEIFDAGGLSDLPIRLPISLVRLRINSAVMRNATLMQLVRLVWPPSLSQLTFSFAPWPIDEDPPTIPDPHEGRPKLLYLLGDSKLMPQMRLPNSLRTLEFSCTVRLASIEQFPFPPSLTRLEYASFVHTHLCPPMWSNAPCLLPSNDSFEAAAAYANHYLIPDHSCSKPISISSSPSVLAFSKSIPHTIACDWPSSIRGLNLDLYEGPAAELSLPPSLEKFIFSPSVDFSDTYSLAELHLPNSLMELHIGRIDSLQSFGAYAIWPVAISRNYLFHGLHLPDHLRVFSFPSESHSAHSLDDLPVNIPSSLRELYLWSESQWERQAWFEWPIPQECLVYLYQPEAASLSPITFWSQL